MLSFRYKISFVVVSAQPTFRRFERLNCKTTTTTTATTKKKLKLKTQLSNEYAGVIRKRLTEPIQLSVLTRQCLIHFPKLNSIEWGERIEENIEVGKISYSDFFLFVCFRFMAAAVCKMHIIIFFGFWFDVHYVNG